MCTEGMERSGKKNRSVGPAKESNEDQALPKYESKESELPSYTKKFPFKRTINFHIFLSLDSLLSSAPNIWVKVDIVLIVSRVK